MKRTNISTLFLTLVGIIYMFVSLGAGIITGASSDFWGGFGFLTFGAAVAIIILLIFGNSQTTMKDVFFNTPIYYIGMVYFVVTGIVSVIHMLTGLLSFKWLFVVQLIVFAVFVIYFIFAMINKTNAENVTQKVVEKNNFIRDMNTKLNTIAKICTNRETNIKIESLSEEFKYSIPAAGAGLKEIEDTIKQSVDVLEYQIEKNEFDMADKTLDDIRKALNRRNETAKNIR